MAFTSISNLAIAVGQAIKKELFQLVKDNFDDHESRINQIETNNSKISIWEHLIINASSFSTATGMNYYEATSSFTVTSAQIRIFEKGSLTGTFEIDIKKSVTDLDGTSFVSIFTTRPSIAFASANDYDASTNQVFDVGQIDISPGDYLRFDITSMPSGGVMSKFLLNVYGE